ncbi:urease accessory protein UreD [Ramlibacter tataouinensis]|uniref:Urease accessory protein UreD n=1 Tax=Ramlibacter tataouinensis (strain ATCC BAA-407 / DSM 14655 / LMG 21543 / TTB310) TaxID=365046 RepID=F5XY59_RAMTT|nr:urease accessory protein UreD [Ramlibacter tataouinensis]AEG94384.1 urease accessory protein-like protein [Ramlibacter tataouinensis TTB310]
MTWAARLRLDLQRSGPRTTVRFAHEGPLRMLQSLYPEGPAIAHTVLVHPPGGLVGGDEIDLQVHLGPGAQGLVTTAGASRFYRSDGAVAAQRTRLVLEADARMEWLPLEALCYSGCHADNHLRMELAPGAEVMGWDIVALGLPAAGRPFEQGWLRQHLEVAGGWLERGTLDAADRRLLDGPLGLAGRRCLATLFLAGGSGFDRDRRERALGLAREVIDGHALRDSAGATLPDRATVVVRVLAPLVEPARQLLQAVRDAWRPALWGQAASQPRTWAL